jgi:hypothetical protein
MYMAEKVVHEVRFIETDDGFRIEVKGDKEHIKEMFESSMCSMHGMGFMSGMKHGAMKNMRRHARKVRRYGPGFMMPPWMWCDMWDEETDAGKAETPATSEA